MSVINEDQVTETVMVLNLDDDLVNSGVVWFRSVIQEDLISTTLHRMPQELWEALGSPTEITIRTKPGYVIGNYFDQRNSTDV